MSEDTKADFNDYGKQKDLTEILEELCLYCTLKTGDLNTRVDLVLPKKVVDAYTLQWTSKEKTEPPFKPLKEASIKELHLNAGVVNIHSADDKKVVDK